jgi:hypothetical protein
MENKADTYTGKFATEERIKIILATENTDAAEKNETNFSHRGHRGHRG